MKNPKEKTSLTQKNKYLYIDFCGIVELLDFFVVCSSFALF